MDGAALGIEEDRFREGGGERALANAFRAIDYDPLWFGDLTTNEWQAGCLVVLHNYLRLDFELSPVSSGEMG